MKTAAQERVFPLPVIRCSGTSGNCFRCNAAANGELADGRIPAGLPSDRYGSRCDAAHILVLEDDEGLRYSHCKILENVGYVSRPFPDFRNFLEPLVPDVLLHAVEASLPMVRDRIVPPSAGATSLIQDAETVGV
jgi:hypothetical protein